MWVIPVMGGVLLVLILLFGGKKRRPRGGGYVHEGMEFESPEAAAEHLEEVADLIEDPEEAEVALAAARNLGYVEKDPLVLGLIAKTEGYTYGGRRYESRAGFRAWFVENFTVVVREIQAAKAVNAGWGDSLFHVSENIIGFGESPDSTIAAMQWMRLPDTDPTWAYVRALVAGEIPKDPAGPAFDVGV